MNYLVGMFLGTIIGAAIGGYYSNRIYWRHVPYIFVTELSLWWLVHADGYGNNPEGDSPLTALIRLTTDGSGTLFSAYAFTALALRVLGPVYVIGRGIIKARSPKPPPESDNQSLGYTWGRTLGVLQIITGVAIIVAMRFAPHFDPVSFPQVDSELSSLNMLVTYAQCAVLIVPGFLILFKKSLGWYLLFLIHPLIVVGMFCLVVETISIPAFYGVYLPKLMPIGVVIAFVLSSLPLIFLWTQVRYWREGLYETHLHIPLSVPVVILI